MNRRSTNLDGVEYAPGRKFRVVKEGLRVSGWLPDGPMSFRGWGHSLEVGEVIECAGYGAGWGSDPGYGVEFNVDHPGREGKMQVEVWPSTGGAFAYRPPPGVLGARG